MPTSSHRIAVRSFVSPVGAFLPEIFRAGILFGIVRFVHNVAAGWVVLLHIRVPAELIHEGDKTLDRVADLSSRIATPEQCGEVEQGARCAAADYAELKHG